MPSRDPSDNSVILYAQMGNWDTTKYTVHQAFKSVLFVEEILLLRFLIFSIRYNTIIPFFSDPIQINGIKLLDNLSGASMNHFMAMERRAINLWGDATSKTVPLRMKKVCLFNVSTNSIYSRPEKI